MKRVISWILVVALVLGLVGMIAFTTSAEEYTPDVEITMPSYGAGSAATLEGVAVTGGTLDAQSSGWWLRTDEGWEEFTGTLQEGDLYHLRVEVTAPEGTYGQEPVIFVNGALWEGGCSWDGDGGHLAIEVSVDLRPQQVEWVELGGLPDEIVPGAAEAPALEVIDGGATVVSARWVDADKNAVTAIEEGKVYYLEVKLAPEDGYEFRDWFDASGYYSAEETQIVSQTEALVWFRYSMLPSVGKITLTTSGMAEGKPVTGVKAEVTGNATLAEIRIYDTTAEEMVEDGNFEAKKNYQITYMLAAKDGYEFGRDVELECNGNFGMEWNYDAEHLYVTEYFSTCEKIEKVEVTVTEPKVDAKVADTKLTLPKDAPYTAEITWVDTNDYSQAEGTFQKGHRYQLGVDLQAAEGYIFAEDAEITINGEEKEYGGIDSSGLYAWAYKEYSFLDKITKVELPAQPDSIKKGDTLPTDFAVNEDAGYTLEAGWGLMPQSGTVEKVEEDGSYVLFFYVNAKEGYEFADDVTVTVGGKKVSSPMNYETSLQLFKVYNIGMKVIDKIELTVDAPNKGNTPKEPKFSEGVKFECMDHYWSQNKSGNILDDSAQIETFKEGYYNYLTVALMAEEGYAFADDVDIYVNGKKVKTVAAINVGSVAQLGISFGKLGKATNSDTADTMPVGAFVCLGVIALCGMAVTVAGKKKYCA